jgi:hypothetical protein
MQGKILNAICEKKRGIATAKKERAVCLRMRSTWNGVEDGHGI